ncbi:ATP-binding protein [Pseudomonas sp. TKO26]|uniref:helicase HerA-like domain-containing protein n=1 Tax=unclassified Pseudomonas TaxID=196821 RepID=UPI000D975040|nr:MULTISPECIES: helicase HerA-like domain-containing protein [unclassified Pseudomonas]PYY92391.1 ATP-binding protein [Pseudomonas sp. TKO30]PYY94754.1 ATP-binding protein [Pseudomonas sp. TKO29]PYY96627.1 ATP-binding protein [Pseudomonas sp. TKO26]PYZ02219.1 ATP-binding protein [Pseudomonas sp. TKO14]
MPDSLQLIIGADLGGQPVAQAMRLANRHGLVAGATGTGKTVTLQRLAEAFSDAGVAVFAADIKGDLCGLGAAGDPQGKVAARIAGMPWLKHRPQAYPVTLWDIQGQSGHPLRTTLSEMGPLLLGSLLELTDSQQSALYAAFKVADREGLLLLDLKDLKALLNHLRDNPQLLGDDAALMTSGSSQALLRRLAILEQQGAEALFGEPALQLNDILQPAADGRGRIHLLDASRLVHEAPKVYATFLLWLLAELFEQLPERGDGEKPLLALFFDEAHLLFSGTPKALQDRLEQVVRLIRSKGVGVYFVTQSPGDLPDDVLAQLGLRIQHGLRAFTAKEQKSLRAVAEGFRPNPAFDALSVLTELGIGEALVGTLQDKGTPEVVQRVLVAPPQSRIGPLTAAERQALIASSPLQGRYDQPIDRESAYEVLMGRKNLAPEESATADKPGEQEPSLADRAGEFLGTAAGQALKSAMRQAANQLGRQLVRGLMGSLLGGSKRR